MKKDIYLKKLLSQKQMAILLQNFAPLLGPEVSLAVGDETGHLLEKYDPSLKKQDGSSIPSKGKRGNAFPRNILSSLLEADPNESSPAEGVVITPQGAAALIYVERQPVGSILATGPLPTPTQTQRVLSALKHSLESLGKVAAEKRAIAHETLERYREINLLYDLGETLATCLNVDELLQRTLAESNKIIKARWGVVLLYDETKELNIAASIGLTERAKEAIKKERELMEKVARTGKSKSINSFINEKQSVSLLAVPLHTSERQLGAILLADKANEESFTAGDEKLLAALSWQAAIALENARLFDNVRRQRDEIATMKRYMDNIFASIASGVITIDTQDVITTFNQAAENILRIPAQQVVNHPYQERLKFLHDTYLPKILKNVNQYNDTSVAQEVSPRLPRREDFYLNLSFSTLRGSGRENLGVAIVMDDVTEKHRYEQERALVRRYLPHELVDQFPHDLAELGLHGERRIITAFFADLRSFTKFSEVNPSEQVVKVLNGYLALAEEAVRHHQGIVDKYMGDAVMALFNTPLLEEEEHAWRAVQTAWALKKAVEAHYRKIAQDEHLFVGVGICTGEAVVGNVGAEGRMEYTAIGDAVNLAFHLQGSAEPGQILLSRQTWERVRDRIQARPLTVGGIKGHQSSTLAYELEGLVTAE